MPHAATRVTPSCVFFIRWRRERSSSLPGVESADGSVFPNTEFSVLSLLPVPFATLATLPDSLEAPMRTIVARVIGSSMRNLVTPALVRNATLGTRARRKGAGVEAAKCVSRFKVADDEGEYRSGTDAGKTPKADAK